MNEWSDDDKEKAERQGWMLHRVWDMDRKQMECAIFKCDISNIFLTDEAARAFVIESTKKGDALATKAAGMVFRSRVGQPQAKTRTKARA